MTRAAKALVWGVVSTWLICVAGYAWRMSVEVPTMHLDGAFQTANSLYRVDAGYLPGRDFYPYLGVGLVYSLFPLFKVFGSHLAASQMAAFLLCALSSMVALSLVFRLVVPRLGGLQALALGAAVHLALGLAVHAAGGALGRASEVLGFSPGNSLRPMRSVLPYLTIWVWLGLLSLRDPVLRWAASGAACGALLLWSNDYAFATFGLAMLGLALRWWWGSRRLELAWVLAFAVSFLASHLGLTWAATGGHWVPMVLFNFQDVARDQWWYFGPYGDEFRVFRLADLHTVVTRGGILPCLLLIAGVAWMAWRRRDARLALVPWLGLAAYGGGAVAAVGGHNTQGYFGALYFWALAVVLAALLAWGRRWWGPLVTAVAETPLRAGGAALVLVCVGAVSLWRIHEARQATSAHPQFVYVEELGAHIHRDWQPYIEWSRALPPSTRVAEEYWGVLSAVRRSFFVWKVDSVIHALGRQRERSAATLEQADWIVSTRYRQDHAVLAAWQPWSVSQNPWFYLPLVERWEPVMSSPMTVVWRKATQAPAVGDPVVCQVALSSERRGQIELRVPRPGYYVVQLGYAVSRPSRQLLFLQNNLSSGSDAAGRISLDPAARSARVIVRVPVAGPNPLPVDLRGSGPATLRLSGCTATPAGSSPAQILPPA